ncbi:MAG TPA: FdhF/YdeP family oxidoreductase [Polyangiaceae bacterium]|nr:FdhF/YdeP family oxidoreductase [Polyangiaceae bacterium]
MVRADAPTTTPVETGEPVVESPATSAGGLPAVISSTRYLLRESGLRRGLRVLSAVNQQHGFDCPSCAWPDPKKPSTAEFCENGARAVADEATTRRVGPDFFREHSIPDLLQRSDAWLNAQGRLTHPVCRDAGADHYREISWEDAFTLLAAELNAMSSPDEAAFYTSGRTSNEAAFLYQLFVRELGTNNLPDCSNLCHESSGRGMSEVVGIGKGTVRLEDFEHADAIFVFGQNPGTNHPRMLTTLREAKLRGAKVVAVNPLREAGLLRFSHPQKPGDLFGGVALADLYLQVRIGGDIALLKAMMKIILEADAIDREFIERYTVGFEALRADLEALSFSELVAQSGVPEEQVRAAAEIAIQSRATICCWAMGLTQHKHGVANVQEVINFLLLRGMLGRPGAGACPVRGHSNVQGDRTMGIWEKPPPWTAKLAERFHFAAPQATGLNSVGAIRAMREGQIRVFFALGGNFLSAAPDTEITARALERTRLTTHVSTKLNRSHLVTGRRALILPCMGRTEVDSSGFVTVEDSMSVVHASRGVLPPASDTLLSEASIVARLAEATLGARSEVPYRELAADYARIRELISETIPGFADYNQRVEVPGGFTLPNSARELDFSKLGGHAHFTVQAVPRFDLEPDQLLLSTVRSHDQFNTTVYDVNDRYRGVFGHRRVLFMNPADLSERGLRNGDKVCITSHFRGETRQARGFTALAYDTPRQTAAAYFPEANVLVPAEHFADKSQTPASKSVVISVSADS